MMLCLVFREPARQMAERYGITLFGGVLLMEGQRQLNQIFIRRRHVRRRVVEAASFAGAVSLADVRTLP